jgi:plastocyanin
MPRIAVVIAALFAAFVLGLAVAGCGGGSSASSDTTTAAETTTAETTTAQTTTEDSGGGAATGAELDGEVGPGFTIELSQDGSKAATVKAGTYTLKVEDKSDQHNFHLIGPGVDEAVTDVPFMGEKTVTVKLEKGTYTYQCDPHAASGMKGTFTVE